MTSEFLTYEQLDTVYGATQIPMIKEPPADKIPPRPKTNTERELKVPLITIVPYPYIKDTCSEQVRAGWSERLTPDIPIEITRGVLIIKREAGNLLCVWKSCRAEQLGSVGKLSDELQGTEVAMDGGRAAY